MIRPVPRSSHVLQCRLGHVERPGEVHREHRVPVLDRHLHGHLVDGDAGVVDEDVEAAVLVEHLLDDPAAVLRPETLPWWTVARDGSGKSSRNESRNSSALTVWPLYPAATEAPWLARLRQIAAPMPRVPPVTRATRPDSFSPVTSGAGRSDCGSRALIVVPPEVVGLLMKSRVGDHQAHSAEGLRFGWTRSGLAPLHTFGREEAPPCRGPGQEQSRLLPCTVPPLDSPSNAGARCTKRGRGPAPRAVSARTDRSGVRSERAYSGVRVSLG